MCRRTGLQIPSKIRHSYCGAQAWYGEQSVCESAVGVWFLVIYSHIKMGQDFFLMEVPECDYIISNPPYSQKGRVLERLYEIGKPFAMLIQLSGYI